MIVPDSASAKLGKCKIQTRDSRFRCEFLAMKIIERAGEKAAAGYILLWLLGIPIPILLLFFLLRGCT